MNSTQDTTPRTRDDVRDELERAICGAMCGAAAIRAIAAGTNGPDRVDDTVLEWLADKTHADASEAFDLAEEFGRVSRPARSPEQQQCSEEAVALHVRKRAEKARRDLAEAEAYEALLETGGVAAVMAEADKGMERMRAELLAGTD